MEYEDSGLRRLQENLRGLSNTQQVPLTELLSPEFMRQHTHFVSFDAMLDASPFAVTADDFQAIPDDDWDAYVRKVTPFGSWENMQKEAGVAWVRARLLRGLE